MTRILSAASRCRTLTLYATTTLLLLLTPASAAIAFEFPGPNPGRARARLAEGELALENEVIAVQWQVTENAFRLERVEDRMAQKHLEPDSDAFVISLADGKRWTSSQLQLSSPPALTRLGPKPDSVRQAEREAGWKAEVRLRSRDGMYDVLWTATLRDRANYVRTSLTILGGQDATEPARAVVLQLPRVVGHAAGTVSGSPIVADNWFFACEHPLAQNQADKDGIICASQYRYGWQQQGKWTRTAVLGAAPARQMRRAFQYYVERERARPYRLFLHYNSWWDIAWPGRRMTEDECLEVIESFGRELFEKRGVALDSFVFDDGWDDPKTLWQFHDGFPRGFAKLREAAERQRSAIGVWLSPWGGYGQAKRDRLAYGETQGFETNSRGFSLAGPTYYARFSETCRQMIDRYGVNYFKFDGVGSGTGQPGADEEVAPDIEALLRLADDLRRRRPDVYLSITTGTWPSPYWLWHGDSVWRNGHDLGFYGAGSMREQSITYRDMQVKRMIVDRAPLYPLNSLMTVTVCQAQLGTAAKMVGDLEDLPNEIRMAFGSGTQLLESYVTPSRMTDRGWDVLAECVRWSRTNADVLVDVHWVGGDPGEAQVYGYAAWSSRKGLLVLRNPADSEQSFEFDLASVFELPPKTPKRYQITTPWSGPQRPLPERLPASDRIKVTLEPFEILLVEAVPEAS